MSKELSFTPSDKPFSVLSTEADQDYLLARLINFSGAGFAGRAGYFSQQACEKYLKSLMIQEEQKYLKTHDLLQLAEYCKRFDPIIGGEQFIEKLKVFDHFREIGRYGGESVYDPEAKTESGFSTAGVFMWEPINIQMLDEIVYILRTKLDFKKILFSDSLDSILKDNGNDIIVGTWQLPIPLKEILLLSNNFYKNIAS